MFPYVHYHVAIYQVISVLTKARVGGGGANGVQDL